MINCYIPELNRGLPKKDRLLSRSWSRSRSSCSTPMALGGVQLSTNSTQLYFGCYLLFSWELKGCEPVSMCHLCSVAKETLWQLSGVDVGTEEECVFVVTSGVNVASLNTGNITGIEDAEGLLGCCYGVCVARYSMIAAYITHSDKTQRRWSAEELCL